MNLSEHLKKNINESCLAILTHPMFMHYWSGTTKKNSQDPEWQNQAYFFWETTEPFERKSLPPTFKKFNRKYFLIKNVIEGIQLQKATAIPWFGMPGGGSKYAFTLNNTEQSIIDLVDKEMLEYIEIITLTDDNDYVLQDRENYFFHMNQTKLQYQNNSFFLNGKPVSIIDAYKSGGLQVLKK